MESGDDIKPSHAAPDAYDRIAHEYELPMIVRMKMEADSKQAEAIAIVITLLASALITLTSILGGIDSKYEGSDGWKGFRVLMWSAIIFDMGEAFVCIFVIKMCAELPLLAVERQIRLRDQSANSDLAPRKDESDRKYDRYQLLESVGMPRLYRFVDCLVIWMLVMASTLSFVTLFYWVAQTQTTLTATLTIISFLIVVVIVLTVFAISMGLGRNWRQT